MKIILLFSLIMVSFLCYSQDSIEIFKEKKTKDSLQLRVDQGKGEYYKDYHGSWRYRETDIGNKQFEIAKKDMDTSFQLAKDIGSILKNEVKTYGLKKTIKANANVFLPFAIFFILFLLWLSGRKK
jgi:hypothetical protein